ncbi:m-phase inducer phosphatase [Basidiobolus ranarum]|uniref:protein-tyrosine-phosphatase n=1 Tax=Basidiobolus ranarum TaxID=34480 RepID=A0ABR2WNK8_9FUNG
MPFQSLVVSSTPLKNGHCSPTEPLALTSLQSSLGLEEPASLVNPSENPMPTSCALELATRTSNLMELPWFSHPDDTFPRISTETFIQLYHGGYNSEFLIVDCRFEYEYRGGHVPGAINLSNLEQLESWFTESHHSSEPTSPILILHCEYSQYRAPKMASRLRSLDRLYNLTSYPKLTFPQVYILHGGYRSLYNHPRVKAQSLPLTYMPSKAANRTKTIEQWSRFHQSGRQKRQNYTSPYHYPKALNRTTDVTQDKLKFHRQPRLISNVNER